MAPLKGCDCDGTGWKGTPHCLCSTGPQKTCLVHRERSAADNDPAGNHHTEAAEGGPHRKPQSVKRQAMMSVHGTFGRKLGQERAPLDRSQVRDMAPELSFSCATGWPNSAISPSSSFLETLPPISATAAESGIEVAADEVVTVPRRRTSPRYWSNPPDRKTSPSRADARQRPPGWASRLLRAELVAGAVRGDAVALDVAGCAAIALRSFRRSQTAVTPSSLRVSC